MFLKLLLRRNLPDAATADASDGLIESVRDSMSEAVRKVLLVRLFYYCKLFVGI